VKSENSFSEGEREEEEEREEIYRII